MNKIFRSVFVVLLLLAFVGTAPAARYEDLTVGKLTVERSLAVQGLLQAAANTTGKVFYVSSTAPGINAIGRGESSDKPFATVDYAINQTRASKGDFIIVMPGHAESYTAADGFDADVAGVTIVMLGEGASAPTFTFADTDATIACGAAGVKIHGGRYHAGISEVVKAISVEAACDKSTFEYMLFPEPTTATWEFDKTFVLASAADDVTIRNSVSYRTGATGATDFIEAVAGVVNRVTVVDNFVIGEYSQAVLYSDQINTNMDVSRNVFANMTTGQYAIELTAAATGIAADNRLYTDTYATTLDPGSLKCLGNLVTIAVDGGSRAIPGDGVIGDIADSAATGAVTTTDTLMSYVKQIVTMTGTEADTDPIAEILSGTTGISTWKAGVAPGDGVSISEGLRYASENLGAVDTAAATGAVTATDSIMAYQKQIVTDVEKIENAALSATPTANSLSRFVASGGTALGTQLADSKSLVDALGSDGTTLSDNTTSIVGVLGVNDADNAFNSSAVADNADGSILERLEHVQVDTDKIDGASLAVAPTAGSLARFVASGGTALGTQLADSKSLVDALGSDGTTLSDNTTSIVGILGVNDADNAFDSSAVASNRDGSLLERSEYLMTEVNKIDGATLAVNPTANSLARFIASGGTALGTQLADSKSIVDALGTNGTTVADTATGLAGMIGVNDADNAMDTSTVVANANGSLFERDEALQVAASPSKNHPNYFTVTADMTSATWNTAAAHEIATVTGAVRMQIMAEVTGTVVTVGTNGTIALGYEGNTSAIFSATALDAALTGDVFSAVYGAAATTPAAGADAQSALTHAIFDAVVVGGMDVGYTIATNAGTNGTIVFHIWWQPLSATGAVAAGAGGVL